MRIVLELSGGFAVFPGLQRDIVVDTARLPDPQASQLRELVRRAEPDGGGPGGDASSPAPPGSADVRSYTLTVEAQDCQSVVMSFSDPIGDEALADLVAMLQQLSRPDR